MAKIKAFSSVSVMDLLDVGSINLYCTSNQPVSVIYDPNQNNYIPDWSTSPHLVITPVITYNGTTLPLNATGLVINYKRKEGSNNQAVLTAGENVQGGILTVSANKLSTISSGQLTYICSVEYTDPDVGVPITTETYLSYTLVSQASDVKYASISGETNFLYDQEKRIVGSGEITLTADLTHVSVVQWQYKKADGTFEAFPTTYNQQINQTTLVVNEREQGIWLNDKMAVIKLVTSENSVYDIHQINKIYDGAAGDTVISAILTNENHYLPCSSDGTVLSWTGSETEIRIFEGGSDVTSDGWVINVNEGNGLTGAYNATTHKYIPASLSDTTSYVDFICSKTGYSDITKRFTLTKQIQGGKGADAVVYDLEPDCYTINLDESENFTPSSVTFRSYSKVGNNQRSNYDGRFVISESTDGATFTVKYTSSMDENSKVYEPSTKSVQIINCKLYASGGTNTLVDEQSIIITRDGKSGEDGNPGTDGLSMGLNNYTDVVPCDINGNAISARNFQIPFYAYKGIVRVPVTATVGTLPSGVSVASNNNGTVSSDGLLVLTVASGATFGDSSLMSGDITITLSAEGRNVDQKYSWTKSKQSANGKDAVILQLYSEDGGNVSNTKTSTTIKLQLTSGTTTVTPTNVVWKEFSNGGYNTIDGESGTSITITNDTVTDQMWLQCTATYDGKPYTAYYTIDDVSDPYVSYTYATVQQFKNNQGFGAVYTRVYQSGTEIDPIKSTTFTDTPPSSPSSGDFYYHLDQTNKTCVLKKYNGTSWQNASEQDELTYKYYRANNQGTMLDTNSPYKQQRCFYIDPSIINGRMQFFCEVSD